MTRQLTIALLLLGALLCGPALAADCTLINATSTTAGTFYPLATAQTINGDAGTLTSSCVKLENVVTLSLWKKCSSAGGTPHITVDWEGSPTRETTDFATADAAVFSDATADGTAELAAIVSPLALYGRIVINGEASNATDTSCTVRLLLQGVP